MKFSPILIAAAMIVSVFYTAYSGLNIPFFLSLLLLLVICSAIKRRIDIVTLVVILCSMASAVSYEISASVKSHPTLSYIDKEVIINGITISSAQESTSSDNYKYTFNVRTLTYNNTIIDINDTVLLSTPYKLNCGDSISVKGTIKSLQEQMNENGFDMAQHYKSKNIFTRIYSEDVISCEPIKVFTLSSICGKFRDWVDNIIYKYYRDDGAAVLSAALTGNTHHFSSEYTALLNRTGFKRLFHPAYLHILIISSFIGLFAGLTHKKLRDIGLIIILVLYAMLNSEQIGFFRCIISCALMIFFRNKNGNAYYPDTIAWILIFSSIFTPMILFNSGFILSIAAGIIMWAFLPYITKKLRFLPRYIRKTTAAMTVCAFLYTPVSLFFFNGICIYSFLLPFVTVPLVMIILASAPIVFAMLTLFGTALPIKPYLDCALLILLRLPKLVSGLPFSYISIPTPSPAGMLLVISLLFLLYYYINNKKLHLYFASAISSGLCVSLIISAILRIGTTNFNFVNVGQGDGAVIHTAYGATVIIDGGGSSNYSEYNPGESIYLPYLESKGYTDIDAAFISHFHRDHAQGIIAAIKNLRVKNLFVPSPEPDWDEDTLLLLAEAEAASKENGTKIHYITENISLTFDNGLIVSAFAPNAATITSKDGNDSSLLIKAEYGNTSVLYTGDMTEFAEREYMNRGIDVSSDILKVAHHGSATSTCSDWVNAVNPSYAVISCGKDNSYGHPKEQTLNNLKGVNILRTDIHGDIQITADKEDIRRISILK